MNRVKISPPQTQSWNSHKLKRFCDGHELLRTQTICFKLTNPPEINVLTVFKAGGISQVLGEIESLKPTAKSSRQTQEVL